jgi:hypothetical protein
MNLLSILRWAGGYSSAVSYAVNDVVEAAGPGYSFGFKAKATPVVAP